MGGRHRVLIDVLDDDPEFGRASALTLDMCAGEGLVICPVTYTELAPSLEGDTARQGEFLGRSRRRFPAGLALG